MKFTGRILDLLALAVLLAKVEIHNQIETCPDVFEHADKIAALRALLAKFERIESRILAAQEARS